MFKDFFTRVASGVVQDMLSPSPRSPDGADGGTYYNWTSPFRNSTSPTREEAPESPHKVVNELFGSSTRKQVADYPVHQRAGSLILHGKLDRAVSPVYYNLILHVHGSDKLFSLCRSDVLEEVEQDFIVFQECVVPLAKIDTQICNKSQLDEMSAVIRKNPGWTAAHLCAALDLHKYFVDPTIKPLINYQEGAELKTPLHVAIEYGKSNSVEVLLGLKAQIDLTDIHGNNIIHTAVAKPDSSVTVLKVILKEAESKSPMLKDLLNGRGCTPLHIATEQNAGDLVRILLELGVNVNVAYKETFPIHMAVRNKSECTIKEINKIDRSQMSLKDLKDGGTPLHWAETPETVNLLLDLGCDPNIVNNHGQTALHLAALQGDLRSTLLLLGHHCFPDLQDNDGDTALHIASRVCAKPVMKALMVFKASINLKNNLGHTARHIVSTSARDDADEALFFLDRVGAERCPPRKAGCTSGCTGTASLADPNNGKVPVNFPNITYSENGLMSDALAALSVIEADQRNRSCDPPKKSKLDRDFNVKDDQTIGGRLLCLDGGGIRGLVLTQILLCIEEMLEQPINTCFDWISGTSTGGILGLGLACGKSVLELQCLYMRLKDEIFTGSKPYSSEVMETFLKKEFGEFHKMSDIHRPRVMITTTLVDTRPAEFHFFRNYMSPTSILNRNSQPDPGMDEYVWQVAKWTGAAPSFFKLDGSRYIDGGLVSNNPTMDALTELVHLSSAMKAVGDYGCQDIKIPNCVVSLGCGIQPKVAVNPQHMDVCVPSGIFQTISTLTRLPAFVNMLVDQATLSEGQIVERSRAWCSSIGVPFFRFSPQCPVFVDLDETNDEILVDLMWITRAYLHANRSKLIELKEVLLSRAPDAGHSDMAVDLHKLSL